MRDSDCVFCKINSDEIDSEKIYQSETCFAIRDINPIAATHILIIPNFHITYLELIDSRNVFDFNQMYFFALEIAVKENVLESGYRLVINQKEDSGQVIEHLHLHLIGGNKLGVIG